MKANHIDHHKMGIRKMKNDFTIKKSTDKTLMIIKFYKTNNVKLVSRKYIKLEYFCLHGRFYKFDFNYFQININTFL